MGSISAVIFSVFFLFQSDRPKYNPHFEIAAIGLRGRYLHLQCISTFGESVTDSVTVSLSFLSLPLSLVFILFTVLKAPFPHQTVKPFQKLCHSKIKYVLEPLCSGSFMTDRSVHMLLDLYALQSFCILFFYLLPLVKWLLFCCSKFFENGLNVSCGNGACTAIKAWQVLVIFAMPL